MLTVVAIMFCGMALGFFLRHKKLRFVTGVVTVLIWLLLFFLGLDVGMNPSIMQAIQSLGLEALLLSLAGIVGSVALAWALWWLASRKKKGGEP